MLTSFIPPGQEQEGKLGCFTLRKRSDASDVNILRMESEEPVLSQKEKEREKNVSKIYSLYICLTENLPPALTFSFHQTVL